MDCVTELCVQARASPYKAGVDHYNVKNVNSPLRIRLGLQRVSFVEIWSADLWQTQELYSSESDTPWLPSKKVKYTLFWFLWILNFAFFTHKIYLNFELIFKICYTGDETNFLLSEYTGAKWRWSLFGGRKEDRTKSGSITECSFERSQNFQGLFLPSRVDAHFLPRRSEAFVASVQLCFFFNSESRDALMMESLAQTYCWRPKYFNKKKNHFILRLGNKRENDHQRRPGTDVFLYDTWKRNSIYKLISKILVRFRFTGFGQRNYRSFFHLF